MCTLQSYPTIGFADQLVFLDATNFAIEPLLWRQMGLQ